MMPFIDRDENGGIVGVYASQQRPGQEYAATAEIQIPVVVPASCTRRQGRLALLTVGKLVAAESFIDSIADPVAKMQARIEYEADTWERANAFLQQAWEELAGTSAELDNLFSLAVTL